MRRDSAMQRDQQAGSRARFTGALIQAIEELELRRLNRSSQELADAGWAKLQFDLPVVEAAELQALAQQLSESLAGKAGWPCYSLTAKALDNITAGARRSSGFEPDLPQQQVQVQQLVSDSLTRAVLRKSGQQQQAEQQAQQQQGAAATQQQLYQQLAAVLLLQYVAKLLLLPEQDAWQLLASYKPHAEEQHCSSDPWQQQQQQQQPASVDDVLAAMSAGNGGSAAAGGTSSAAAAVEAAAAAAPSAAVYELVEAAEQDADDESYEALEPVGPPAPVLPPSQQQQQQQQPYSWEALRHKLLSLADSVHYSTLAHEPLWAQHGADGHLLTLLRALGVHVRAGELQPLLHAYVGLLIDRLAAAPTQLPLLAQLWEALGLAGGLRSRPCSARQQQQQLPAEAVLAFSVAASAWQQLPAGSARASLWRLMYEHLLPPLEQSTEQLAYSSGTAAAAAAAAVQQQQQQQQQQQPCGESFAHVLLCCHVIELLVLGRPLAVDAAGQLTQRGITRNLVQLWGQHASTGAAEPLRRAMLLACCASADTAGWVLVVPQVLAQLQAPLFQLGGAAEAHGALWQLLLSRSCAAKQQQQQTSGAAAAAAAPASGADNWQCDQLLSLLGLQLCSDGDARQLQRLVCLLQLMADAQQAAGRQQLWGKPVLAALRRVAAAVKASEATAAAAAAAATASTAAANGSAAGGSMAASNGGGDAAAAVERAAAARSDSDDDNDTLPGAPPKTRRPAKGVAADGAALARRQSQQLQAAALRLVKGLLTQGGKTD